MQTAFSNTGSIGRFDGMMKIFCFNWRRYVGTFAACCLSFGIAPSLNLGLRWITFAGVGVAMFWLLASLIVSHWIYDRSEIYGWKWIARWLPIEPKTWVNIHAGLDDSSAALKTLFPNSQGVVFDIFDPNEMTEASIVEARKGKATAEAVDFRNLPVADEKFDVIFLIFAAHELRRASAREDFFKELFRISKNGRVLLLEHVRDWRNFAAFGPGFLHFHARSEWLRLATKAGFAVVTETNMTPFVRLFILRKDV